MCSCQHKIHWSIVAILVNVISIALFTTGVSTANWAQKYVSSYGVNTGLFQTCTQLNDTCYDTHVYFDGYSQKDQLLASAVINVFALIGMFLFFALSVFFLCGLFEEKQLATGAVVTSYLSGLLAVIGTVLFAVTIKSLDFSLGWSFILAVLGFCVNFAAGVLMCVGRNISTRGKKKKKLTNLDTPEIEQVRMTETTDRKKVWSSGATPY